ncbi:MAG: glycosyltransferase family 1 protein [Leucobacter sp.]
MKIAIVAESFLPHMNGVTGSVLQVLRHLSRQGHELLLIAPEAGDFDAGEFDASLRAARTHFVRSLPLPAYPEVRMVFVRPARIAAMLREFGADVVHLASPFTLGWAAGRAAASLGIPCVAVYQTDVTSYAEKYGIPGGAPVVASHLSRIHRRATLTLFPSSAAHTDLESLGVGQLRHWGRGVDTARFTPEHRSTHWRQAVAGERRIVGYVGRLAPEKQVEDLRRLSTMDGVQLVIVGDGPSRAALESQMPDAHFTGHLEGSALATAMASFDVFVHPGESDTFGQTLQEAFASGVPVVATGRGGPVDLVRSSIDGWLYAPGNLEEMGARVADLIGDPAKRAAFSRAAREGVRRRTWPVLCEQLLGYYEEAIQLRHAADAPPATRSATSLARTVPPARAARSGRFRATA